VHGLVLDAEALALLDGPNVESKRRVIALLSEAVRRGLTVHVPATAFAQSFFDARRQSELMRFLERPYVRRHALDFAVARVIGAQRRRTRHLDVVDQHIAALARAFDATIVTSDSDYRKKLGVRSVVRV
jgi:predicted nucleic acid-binding protein